MEYLEFSKYRDSQAFQEAMRIKELETIIKLCDELKSLNSEINPFIYFKKAQALFGLGKEDEGLKVLQIAQEIFNENYGSIEQSHSWSKEVSDLYLRIITEQAKRNLTQPNKSLWLYNEAYQLTKEPELRYELKQKRLQAYLDLVHSSVPLKKFAYIDDELPSQEPFWITPLLTQDVGNIKLIGGAVRKGSFWVAHPLRKRVYYHFADAEQLIFNDYLHEFIQFVQHLGAKEIVLEYINPRQQEGILDPAAEKLPDDVNANMRKVQNTIITHQFNPSQKAHVPTNLVWLAVETEWQNLLAERTQGSLDTFETIFNSKNLVQISGIELEEVQEELNDLISSLQAGSKTESLKKRRNKRTARSDEAIAISLQNVWQSVECRVKVTFAPLEELKQEINLQTLPVVDVELPIPSMESRKMKAVDVSKVVGEVVEKIQVIQETQKPISAQETRLTTPAEEETAYDKWKKMVAQTQKEESKTELQEKEKELSKNRREETPIVEDVVEESNPVTEKIQTNPTPTPESKTEERDSDGFTRDERFYYEMLQHAYQDGYISEDVRKVLERRRQRFKISEERAAEIERIMLERK
ncbi:MAG: hypothetical protein RMJ97_04980 [Raineya sp.]|nr:hypothetical protein [Raineya sp.]